VSVAQEGALRLLVIDNDSAAVLDGLVTLIARGRCRVTMILAGRKSITTGKRLLISHNVKGTTNMASIPSIDALAIFDAVCLAPGHSTCLMLLVLAGIILTWHDRKSDARMSKRIGLLESEIDNIVLPLRQHLNL
jgi:hypothetical protein